MIYMILANRICICLYHAYTRICRTYYILYEYIVRTLISCYIYLLVTKKNLHYLPISTPIPEQLAI